MASLTDEERLDLTRRAKRDPHAAMVLADWCEDRGYTETANDWRAEAQSITWHKLWSEIDHQIGEPNAYVGIGPNAMRMLQKKIRAAVKEGLLTPANARQLKQRLKRAYTGRKYQARRLY